MDNLNTVDYFINNFVIKLKRDRIRFELGNQNKRQLFTDRLNHQWNEILDMRYVHQIPQKLNDFDFVLQSLAISGKEKFYVISNYDDIDDKVMEFEEAFNRCYGRGFGTLIISLAG